MQFNCSYTELVSTNKLVNNPKNANNHPSEQIERLAKIIDFQGQRSPIVVSKRSGFITKGHGRLMAMKLLKWEQVAVDYQDYLSEAQEYADVVADNEIARWAEIDSFKVLTDLKELDFGDFDLLGFKDSDFLTKNILPDMIEDGTTDHFENPKGTKIITMLLTEEENEEFMSSYDSKKFDNETVKGFIMRMTTGECEVG
jgi:ParB-like nuclease domain